MPTAGTATLKNSGAIAWLPLFALPSAVSLLCANLASWLFMWSLTGAIYAGLKWLSLFADLEFSKVSRDRVLQYLLGWPGMDARAFFAGTAPQTKWTQAAFALLKMVFGAAMFWFIARLAIDRPLVTAWLGMVGVVFMLHFGLFHLVAIGWQYRGAGARPIMNAPILASSVSDFWSRRWNLAFRDVAHKFVFRPTVGRLGVAGGTVLVFLVSGLVHDVVISGSAGAGYGLPTLYFLLQAFGLLIEHSRLGRRIGLGKSMFGRLFAIVVVLGPVGLLFHGPFLQEVVLPMMRELSAI